MFHDKSYLNQLMGWRAVGCFSPLIMEMLLEKPGRGGSIQVYSFLVWKNRFVQGKK